MKRDMPAALIRLQEGVFSRNQALENGFTGKMIDARVRSGTWRVVCRGVYTDTAAHLGRPGMLWAAVLSAGRHAVLSHESAAEKVGLAAGAGREIHVTVPYGRVVAAVPGVVIHRSRRALQAALAECALPCTSAEETVLDLVDGSDTFNDMCGWVTRALNRPRTPALKRGAAVALRDAMGRRGRLRWRPILGDMIHTTITGDHSVLEHRYERDVERAHHLPSPDRQVPFTNPDGSRGWRDRAYSGYRVVIELDGQLYHVPESIWDDKERDNAAIEAGHEPLRYGWKHVTQAPCATAVQLSRVLRANGWPGAPRPCSVSCPVRYEVTAA
jgi:hypothetical protein